jgi:hypothetical protein
VYGGSFRTAAIVRDLGRSAKERGTAMLKSLKWEDWLGVALGLWLLLSPWILGYSDASAATMNALFLGATLIFLEQLNLDVHEDLEEWLDIAAGMWLVASPLVVGFASATVAAINAIAVGTLTVLFAALALSSVDARLAAWWHGHRP